MTNPIGLQRMNSLPITEPIAECQGAFCGHDPRVESELVKCAGPCGRRLCEFCRHKYFFENGVCDECATSVAGDEGHLGEFDDFAEDKAGYR